MTERLLQFIWQFQYFNRSSLTTAVGETLQILHPGRFNQHQGPDFLEGKIAIDNTILAGNIGLHLKAGDWMKHGHQNDANYSNVVLHVVWEHDADIEVVMGVTLPVLVLQPRVPKLLLQRYEELLQQQSFVPCSKYLPAMEEMKWILWKQRLAIERLQRKSAYILQKLEQTNNNWEEVFWQMLSRNFGAKVNTDVFDRVAQSIPIQLLAKHKNQIHQLEALLLGQAGLLDQDFQEDYPVMLRKEYLFLQKKYGLISLNQQPFFLRMRPANFPTVRLAQLAMLVLQSSHLFSKIKESDSLHDLRSLLNVTANDYWHYHYRFDEPTAFLPKQLGLQMTDNIIINTIVPVLFAFGKRNKNETYTERAIQLLEQLPAEKNTIVTGWRSFGVNCGNAVESQALIELKNNFCSDHRCLECMVGNALLKE